MHSHPPITRTTGGRPGTSRASGPCALASERSAQNERAPGLLALFLSPARSSGPLGDSSDGLFCLVSSSPRRSRLTLRREWRDCRGIAHIAVSGFTASLVRTDALARSCARSRRHGAAARCGHGAGLSCSRARRPSSMEAGSQPGKLESTLATPTFGQRRCHHAAFVSRSKSDTRRWISRIAPELQQPRRCVLRDGLVIKINSVSIPKHQTDAMHGFRTLRLKVRFLLATGHPGVAQPPTAGSRQGKA